MKNSGDTIVNVRQPTPFSVCIIGAGISGILSGAKLKEELGIDDFVIFESRAELGGVWAANNYPGCACDVPSHLYSFSDYKNPSWTEFYASQSEILEYLRGYSRKHNLNRNIRFSTVVQKMRWDEEQWIVTILDKKTLLSSELCFNFVRRISATGVLRQPNVPDKFRMFQGPKFHSGEWDHSVALEGKTVGVVGSGASAVQIIPAIAAKVKELHCYQRNPGWILSQNNYKFSSFSKFIFTILPFIGILFRWIIFLWRETLRQGLNHGSWIKEIFKQISRKHLNRQMKDMDSLDRERLVPAYEMGCKRVLLSDTFYQAMCRSNVKLHVDHILGVLPNSLITKSGSQSLDVLILATGFKIHDYFGPMEVIGKNGVNLLNIWKSKGPDAYLGVVNPNAPNYFSVLGPNANLGTNSIIFMAECQVDLILRIFKEMKKRKTKVVELKKSAAEEYKRSILDELRRTVGDSCGAWYEGGAGAPTRVDHWPWSCFRLWRQTKAPDWSKFTFKI